MKPFIPLILGSGRDGRRSEHAAKFVFEILQQDKRLETEFIDVRDYAAPLTARVNEEQFDDGGLVKTLVRADGFLIVTPEYNHGYPGELKLLLDRYYAEYEKKPFGICGVSNGPWGGVRMIESLRQVIVALKGVNCSRTVMFPKAGNLFENNEIETTENQERYRSAVNGLIDELLAFSEALKTLRS